MHELSFVCSREAFLFSLSSSYQSAFDNNRLRHLFNYNLTQWIQMIDSSILVRKISRLRGRILSAAFFRVVFITFQTRKQSAAWNSSSSISHEIRREDTRQSVKWNSARFDNWTWTRYLRRISSQVNMCSTFTLNWAFIAWLSVAILMLFCVDFAVLLLLNDLIFLPSNV